MALVGKGNHFIFRWYFMDFVTLNFLKKKGLKWILTWKTYSENSSLKLLAAFRVSRF